MDDMRQGQPWANGLVQAFLARKEARHELAAIIADPETSEKDRNAAQWRLQRLNRGQ